MPVMQIGQMRMEVREGLVLVKMGVRLA